MATQAKQDSSKKGGRGGKRTTSGGRGGSVSSRSTRDEEKGRQTKLDLEDKQQSAPGAMRRFGSSVAEGWRGIHPQLKRDALAFFLIGVAIVIALREWFGISGQAGEVIHHGVAGLVGIFSVVAPVVLVLWAVGLITARKSGEAIAYRFAGMLGVTVAATGLVQIGMGNPPISPFALIEGAGGLFGWFFTYPLARLLSSWGAGVVLVLLLIYSILVSFRTPVREVPARVSSLWARVTGKTSDGQIEEEPAGLATAGDEWLQREGAKDLSQSSSKKGRSRLRRGAKSEPVSQVHLESDGPFGLGEGVAHVDPSSGPVSQLSLIHI